MPAEAREVIRPSRREDVPALGALFEEAFGTTRDPAIWAWKYFDNPLGCMSWVCEVEGRIVAHCGGTPVRFADGGRELVALQVGDVMSSPSWAGGIGRGGVFFRTSQAFFAAHCGEGKVPLVYGFPGERHRIVGERVLGYHAIEPVFELRLPGRAGGRDGEPLTDGDLELFSKNRPAMGAIRDAGYLRWRYLRHPSWRYGIVEIRRRILPGTQIAALVRQDGESLRVLEVAGRFSRSAIEDLADRLASMGSDVVLWGSPDHPAGRALVEGGFSPQRRDHWLEMRSFTGRAIPGPGEFYYSLGDYDVY